MQEAYLRFIARPQGQTGPAGPDQTTAIAHPLAYLYRIVRNLALDRVRCAAAMGQPANEALLAGLPAPVASPEQTASDRAQLRLLSEALAELPERTRLAFEMHRLQGRSLQEVADRLGVSVVRAHQLVKDALRHAVQRLEAADAGRR